MLRVAAPPPPAWDALLPAQARRLPDELAGIDAYLDDERFITPWRALFAARLGRPSLPVQTLLRLLYLKHRYRLGYESLCREVADSISWRRFCHIGLDQPVPHPTTLVKLVGRAGPQAIDQLNHALLAKLAADKLLRARKLRIDTTVVEADIDHPTDADLLEHAVRTLGGLVRRVRQRGAATRTAFRDRARAAGRRLRQISQTLRRRTGHAPAEIDRLTAQVAAIARRSVAQAEQVARNARRARAKRPDDCRLRWLVCRLEETTAATHRLLAQTQQRLAGNRQIPDRLVSLADPDARPIRKGKPNKPTEFGYTVLLAECERGFIATHHTHQGNPPDAAQLAPAVTEVMTITGRPPDAVAGDRGFGTAANDTALAALGVNRVGLPRKGTPGKARQAYEQTRPFKRLCHWRVGIEARISQLKRSFGFGRTRLRRLAGAQTWVGAGDLHLQPAADDGGRGMSRPLGQGMPTIPLHPPLNHPTQEFFRGK